LFVLAFVTVGGHILLDSVLVDKDSIFYIPWAVLHERTWIELSQDFKVRTSYPLLPWIGVIPLGFIAGEWFNKHVT
ncbi:heparan-alpha-glucosaminide N-acetyltransferase domain-containing protein, partial [Aliarcobacter butzleri]